MLLFLFLYFFFSCSLCLCSISVTSCLNRDFLICLQKQLTQFDAETQEKVAQAELDALPSLEVKHAHARLELREKQLQELAGTMNELSTEEVSYCLFILSGCINQDHVGERRARSSLRHPCSPNKR